MIAYDDVGCDAGIKIGAKGNTYGVQFTNVVTWGECESGVSGTDANLCSTARSCDGDVQFRHIVLLQ